MAAAAALIFNAAVAFVVPASTYQNTLNRAHASQGFGFVEFRDISCAVAARAALDGTAPAPPLAARLIEMGFDPQVALTACATGSVARFTLFFHSLLLPSADRLLRKRCVRLGATKSLHSLCCWMVRLTRCSSSSSSSSSRLNISLSGLPKLLIPPQFLSRDHAITAYKVRHLPDTSSTKRLARQRSLPVPSVLLPAVNRL